MGEARLVLDEELRAAPHVDEELVRLGHVLNLHRGSLPPRGDQRRGRDQVDGVPQRRLRADLGQQLLGVVCAPGARRVARFGLQRCLWLHQLDEALCADMDSAICCTLARTELGGEHYKLGLRELHVGYMPWLCHQL